MVGEGLEVGGELAEFEKCGALAGAGEDEVSLDVWQVVELLKESPAVDGTASAGNSYDHAGCEMGIAHVGKFTINSSVPKTEQKEKAGLALNWLGSI